MSLFSGVRNVLSTGPAGTDSVVVLEPAARLQLLDTRRLWRYRELLGFMALRDIQVRYKQTLLGAAWAVVQPLALMVVLTVLRRIIGVGGNGDPIFLFAAILPWTFFASSVTASTNSLVSNAHMLRKIYFPRLILPLAAIGAPLMDYAIAFVVLLVMMICYQVPLTAGLWLLPLLVATTVIAALGVGVLLSALTASYRDFRYVVALLVQVWFFLTPVVYGIEQIPDRWRWLMGLNPMGGTIAGFRAAVLGEPIDLATWGCSSLVAAICLLAGLFYFSRSERKFADVI